MKVVRKMIGEAVVDVEIQVEPRAGDAGQTGGLEVLDVNQFLECAAAVNAGRLRTGLVVINQCNTPYFHDWAPWGTVAKTAENLVRRETPRDADEVRCDGI